MSGAEIFISPFNTDGTAYTGLLLGFVCAGILTPIAMMKQGRVSWRLALGCCAIMTGFVVAFLMPWSTITDPKVPVTASFLVFDIAAIAFMTTFGCAGGAFWSLVFGLSDSGRKWILMALASGSALAVATVVLKAPHWAVANRFYAIALLWPFGAVAMALAARAKGRKGLEIAALLILGLWFFLTTGCLLVVWLDSMKFITLFL